MTWKGPKPESTGDEPFGRGASKQLKAGAADFKPANGAAVNAKPSPIVFLNEGSTPDDNISRPLILESSAALRPSNTSKDKTAVVGPVGSGDRQVSPDAKVFFTSDMGHHVKLAFPGGHYAKVENIDSSDFEYVMGKLATGVSFCSVHAFPFRRSLTFMLSQFNWQHKVIGQKTLNADPSERFITLLLCFDDLRDAAEAENDVGIVRQKWQLSHITQAEYAASSDANGTQEATDAFDGQVVFSCVWQGDLKDIDTQGLRAAVLAEATELGDVYAFAEMSKPNTQAVEFRVEFYKIKDAHKVLELITDVQPASHMVSLPNRLRKHVTCR